MQVAQEGVVVDRGSPQLEILHLNPYVAVQIRAGQHLLTAEGPLPNDLRSARPGSPQRCAH
jgi:hypothetical protein